MCSKINIKNDDSCAYWKGIAETNNLKIRWSSDFFELQVNPTIINLQAYIFKKVIDCINSNIKQIDKNEDDDDDFYDENLSNKKCKRCVSHATELILSFKPDNSVSLPKFIKLSTFNDMKIKLIEYRHTCMVSDFFSGLTSQWLQDIKKRQLKTLILHHRLLEPLNIPIIGIKNLKRNK